MNLNLEEKVFIVTGGSRGIGGGITESLIEEGASVVVATRSAGDEADQFIERLRNGGGNIEILFGDLQDLEFCKNVVDFTNETYGQIDGIVNNAGQNDGAGLESGPGAFRRSVALNLFHYYDMAHYALPFLKESKGVILNISSKVALTGQGRTSGYAASKGAQLALTREWAAELLVHGIRVNAILPSEVMTPLYRTWLDESFDDPLAKEKEICKKIPLGQRMTKIEEIASTAVFLLSDKASHSTGQFYFVDGGYVHLDRALT